MCIVALYKKSQWIVQQGFMIIILSLAVASLYAQKVNIEYTYKHYSIRDGLSQMQIMAFYQDSKGYLWCSTKAGVSRFNGYEFKNYMEHAIDRKNYELPVFKEDNVGNLLLFDSEEFFRFQTNGFVRHDYPATFSREWSNNQNGASTYLILKKENSPEDHLFEYIHPDSFLMLEIDHQHGRIILIDQSNKNQIWQQKDSDIRIYDLQNKEIIRIYSLADQIIRMYQSNGMILGISEHSVIYAFKDDGVEQVLDLETEPTHIKAITTPDGKALVIKTAKDLYLFDGTLTSIKSDMAFIRDILFDKEGNLWVATEEGLYNFFNLNFKNYTFGMGNKDWVWSIVEDDRNRMWFASYLNGLWRLDGEKVTNFTQTVNRKLQAHICTEDSPNSFKYYMGASRHEGNLYFPTECNVIAFKDGKFSNVPNMQSRPYEITKAASEGSMLFGGVAGLYLMRQDEVLKYWTGQDLGLSSVVDAGQLADGRYIAIGKEGITIVDSDTTQSFHYSPHRNRYCMSRDHKGTIWMGGAGGLSGFRDDSLIHIPVKNQEVIYSSYFEAPKYLFLGGIYGLYLVDLQDYYGDGIWEMVLFDHNNGFTGIECGKNGFFKDSRGDLWVPTSDLVCRFDPQKVIDKQISAPIAELVIDISEDNIHWEPLQDSLYTIPFDHNSIRASLQTISFSNVGKLRYYYQLVGLQDNWSAPSDNNTIVYHNLSWGKYQFMARVDAGIKEATSEILSFDFEVAKPYWLRWWFISSAAILLALFIYLYLHRMRERIRSKELIHKRIVQLRSDALKAQMNPHLIHNALNNINGLINLGRSNEAQAFLTSFSHMLRLVLNSMNRDEISLHEELDIIESYVDFHSHVHGNEIEYKISNYTGRSLAKVHIPPMLLQPYVENAIVHGILPLKSQKGFVNIKLAVSDDRLIIIIEDNGVGMGNSKRKGTGLGTKFTEERIKLLKRGAYHPVKFTALDQGTQVIIDIPLKTNEYESD